ncbi:hypothetical protein TNCV_222721 [Trichonephila clavipes]|nr:hypothetical protein TNCV_222721 [Trichonephila clavipes]
MKKIKGWEIKLTLEDDVRCLPPPLPLSLSLVVTAILDSSFTHNRDAADEKKGPSPRTPLAPGTQDGGNR